MAVYEIIPIREVRKIDVRDTLNANGGVVDDVHSSMYRSAANIDKWSKKKPTKYYKLIFAKGNEEPKQWQADNGLCGFAEDSVVFSSTDALVDAHSNGNIYIYEPPIGGDYPYRLRDFSGYSTKAKSPIWSFEREGEIVANNSASSMTFNIMGDSDIDGDSNLLMSDILPDGSTSLGSYYFGVIVTDSRGNFKALCKSSNTIGTSKGFSRSATLTYSQLGLAGSYIAYPCFVNSSGNKYVACPISEIYFDVKASVDENKLGWMDGTGFWSSGVYFTYTGQLAYTKNWEGTTVFIALQINSEDYSGEQVVLSKDSQSSDGKTYYMTYTRSIRMSVSSGNTYRLRVGYGSGLLNNDYLDLEESSNIEPLNISYEED